MRLNGFAVLEIITDCIGQFRLASCRNSCFPADRSSVAVRASEQLNCRAYLIFALISLCVNESPCGGHFWPYRHPPFSLASALRVSRSRSRACTKGKIKTIKSCLSASSSN
ncbi:hypothetical protein PUN28_017219 [Cardiocondyla obscurior]|uniref:Uncharacterized protein n=1 Tax=Cardiocondyla obscurior TaxID=286306 RepID=A0AAW2ENI0_9HYME